ncbi:hypothetical protein [uncultured Bradyrhizobium sp.]|uniref:hypothetical protein n=1 Tax=uncultured Bradyrhizobium sp. TaxID=199684 RepID=UPI0035CB9565
MSDISEKGSDFLKDLGDAARGNPISAALIGMGILWLMTGGRTAERVGGLARSAGLDRIPDAAGAALDMARSSAESIGDRVSSATDTLRDGAASGFGRVAKAGSEYADAAYGYARNVPDAGGAFFGTARENLSEMFQAQPLALGAIGLAIGAGIAAALPATEVEAQYLGEVSDNLKRQASDFASEQVDRAATIADDVITAVSNEAQKQGLTMDAAKSAVADIPAKVSRVVDAAGKGMSEKLKPAAS